jgi:hypothetical protein
MGIRCFFLTPTDRVRRSLRRFVWSGSEKCQGPFGYHNASVVIDEVQGVFRDDGRRTLSNDDRPEQFAGDPRWPKACSCGREFADADERQVFTELIYQRSDTGEFTAIRDAPPGAMWDAWWMAESWSGADGRCLMVRCPDGHDWMVDGQASNCTMPHDHVHKCWVRHGEPPNITVDKNGVTCAAGAGSIQTPKWHGFLRNGELVE